jgi:hypothetical protein
MVTKKPKKPMLNFAAPVSTVDVKVKLEEPINTELERYRDFIEKTNGVRPSADDIINRALQRIFSKDAAFKEFAGTKGRARGRSSDPPA